MKVTANKKKITTQVNMKEKMKTTEKLLHTKM